MNTETLKEWGWIVWGALLLSMIFLMVIFLDIPSYIRAHQQCSTGNGIVTQQKDFLNPYVCLKINPGVQP